MAGDVLIVVDDQRLRDLLGVVATVEPEVSIKWRT